MADDVVVIQPITPTIVISAPGPQGNVAEVAYVHTQAVAASVWTINHNLGFEPTAVILDSAGTNCEGSFSYPSKNQMVITFNSSFAGTAYVI